MWLSWEPLGWKTPNKVRPVAEAGLFFVRMLSTGATAWPADAKTGPGEAETDWLCPGGLTWAKGEGLGQGLCLWAIYLVKSGILAEC